MRAPIRITYIPNAVDADGEQRVALEVPAKPGDVFRRAALMVFPSIAAAVAAKAAMEGAPHG